MYTFSPFLQFFFSLDISQKRFYTLYWNFSDKIDKNIDGIKVNIKSEFTFFLHIPALIMHNSWWQIISNKNLIRIIP